MSKPLARQTARQLAQLHAEHYRRRGALQRAIERAKEAASLPWLLCVFAAGFLGWIAVHVYVARTKSGIDADPNWLQITLGFVALIMTSLILTGQRRDEELEDERSELTLHMISILDQKLSASQKAVGGATDVEDALNALRDAHREVSDEPAAD